MNLIYLIIKRTLGSLPIFWRFRHFVNNKIFRKPYSKVNEKHLNRFFKKTKFFSVIDFGCATSDKFNYFFQKGAGIYYGIDINPVALETSKQKCQKYRSKRKLEFSLNNKFDENHIKFFLKKNSLKKFDLFFADRSLYNLNSAYLENILKKLKLITNYVYIDDFILDSDLNKDFYRTYIGGYQHTNFGYFLEKNGFYIVKSYKSSYKKTNNFKSKSILLKSNVIR